MRTGVVYTETVIYSPPVAFTSDAPYQTAIVSLEGGSRPVRVSCRIQGERVVIGDRVEEVEPRGGVPFFRKV
jgi:uncharacterized OB-fold protein